MALFENFTRKVTETAKAAAKKSSDLVEVTKINMSISSEEEKIQKEYAAIGKKIYESYKNNEEIAEGLKENCGRIKSYEENIEAMSQKILELKNVKICTGCGAELEADMAFCPKCGAKQEIPEPAAAEPTDKTCPACGNVNTLDAAFCVRCGNKF